MRVSKRSGQTLSFESGKDSQHTTWARIQKNTAPDTRMPPDVNIR